MKPGQDSRPRVPAATPKSDAVRARMFETVWQDQDWVSSRRVDAQGEELSGPLTRALCWTLSCTIGLIACCLSSNMFAWLYNDALRLSPCD